MQEDFHYYATYTAAIIAGYNHEESLAIAYSANLVDFCTATFLGSIKQKTYTSSIIGSIRDKYPNNIQKSV